MNDFRRQWTDTRHEVLRAIERVGESGWYILGVEVEHFEQKLANFAERRHAIGCANGLDAIEIALRAIGIRPGQRVLTTPLSAFATTLAIVRAGGVPVFVDTDENGLIDLGHAEETLAACPDIRFFVPVHLYGAPLDMQRLVRLKNDFHLSLVEDCAQAIGARHDGVIVGSAGQLSTLSFYPTKNLGALGDAGAVLTDDPTLAGRCRELRDYGQTSKYQHDVLGLNSRLDELHAVTLADVFLPRLPEWTKRRQQIAAAYAAEFAARGVRCLGAAGESVWHLFPIFVAERRADLMERLRDAGIQSGIHYPKLIPDQLALQNLEHHLADGLSRARKLVDQQLSLPIHPYMTDSEVSHVVRTVSEWTTKTSP